MYFECSSGTGKGNNLIVTCASDFAGVTITCTNGVKTYSKVCPSSEPYEIEFSGLESGTWTISGTVEGSVYSTNVVIADYTATLESGFDYKAWCTEGGVDATQYSSLADVFADELAVHRLMTVHASADYLIEAVTEDIDIIDDFCANDTAMKWIGLRDYVCDGLTAISGVEAKFLASNYWERYLKDHVPTMTSNTAPYGEASADSTYSSDYPWKAFDGTELVEWNSNINNTGGGQRLIFKFPTPINVRRFRRMNGGTTTNTFKIGYSDDGLTWTDLNTEYVAVGNKAITEEDIENVGYHLYWSTVQISSLTTSRFSTIQLQFYGRALNVSVPVMTSNTAPFGEAFADSSNQAHPPYMVFDNVVNTSNYWGNTGVNHQVGYKFDTKVCVKKVSIIPLQEGGKNKAKDCILKGSNDGTNYTDIDTFETVFKANNNLDKQWFDIDGNTAYQYIKLDITAEQNSTWVRELQFYGVDYSEREFEPNTNKKWLYDHGLEIEPISEAITDGGTITFGDDYVTIDRTVSANLSIATDSAIDLTNYNKLFAIVDTTKNSSVALIGCASARNSNVSSMTANKVITSVGSDVKDCLDISTVDTSQYPILNANNTGTFNVKELWVE